MREMFHAEVRSNNQIVGDVYDMRLYAPKEVAKAKAGQFLSIYTGNPALILPRPLSICELDKVGGEFRIVYRAAGEGTREIAAFRTGDRARCLGPLGSHYRVSQGHKNFALVGGGMGAPPLLELAKKIRQEIPGAVISVYLGFRSKFATILESDFARYANHVYIATDDGTTGLQGNILQAFPAKPIFDAIFSCGPHIMLKSVAKFADTQGIPCTVSVEEHMACSVGACLACVVKVHDNDGGWSYKRVCASGPVFNAKELFWDE